MDLKIRRHHSHDRSRLVIESHRPPYHLLITPKAKQPRLFAVQLPVHVTGRYDDPVTRTQRSSLASTAALAFVGNLLVPGVGLLAPFVKLGSLGSDPCTEAVDAFLDVEGEDGIARATSGEGSR